MVGRAHHGLPTSIYHLFLCLDTQCPVAYFEQLTCGSEVSTKYMMGTNLFGVCSYNVSQNSVYPYHITILELLI